MLLSYELIPPNTIPISYFFNAVVFVAGISQAWINSLKINAFEKPDYVIEPQNVKVSPSIISVADVNFNVQVKIQNIGMASGDSIWVSIKRKLPNDTIRVLVDTLMRGTRNTDTFNLTVPINPTRINLTFFTRHPVGTLSIEN